MSELNTAEFEPLSFQNWEQLKELFGEKGACGGCWCMYWRLTHRDFQASKGERNEQLFQDLVMHKKPLGVIAFIDQKPVGWCSISPRSDLVRLSTSRLLKPVDETSVWSITCLFIDKQHRRRGLSSRLIRVACENARRYGATVVEAYPIIPKKDKVPDVFAWVGFASAFEKAGFEVIDQRSETRVVMRFMLS